VAASWRHWFGINATSQASPSCGIRYILFGLNDSPTSWRWACQHPAHRDQRPWQGVKSVDNKRLGKPGLYGFSRRGAFTQIVFPRSVP